MRAVTVFKLKQSNANAKLTLGVDSYGYSTESGQCVLRQLHMPDSVREQIGEDAQNGALGRYKWGNIILYFDVHALATTFETTWL